MKTTAPLSQLLPNVSLDSFIAVVLLLLVENLNELQFHECLFQPPVAPYAYS